MEIVQEITRDLSEKAADLIEQGKTEEEAIRIAIEDFGDDVEEIKKELVGSEQLRKTKNLGLSFAFSVWGVIIISALFVFINLYYAPHIVWFPFPVFAMAWWPLCVFLLKPRTAKTYSTVSALIILTFFAVDKPDQFAGLFVDAIYGVSFAAVACMQLSWQESAGTAGGSRADHCGDRLLCRAERICLPRLSLDHFPDLCAAVVAAQLGFRQTRARYAVFSLRHADERGVVHFDQCDFNPGLHLGGLSHLYPCVVAAGDLLLLL